MILELHTALHQSERCHEWYMMNTTQSLKRQLLESKPPTRLHNSWPPLSQKLPYSTQDKSSIYQLLHPVTQNFPREPSYLKAQTPLQCHHHLTHRQAQPPPSKTTQVDPLHLISNINTSLWKYERKIPALKIPVRYDCYDAKQAHKCYAVDHFYSGPKRPNFNADPGPPNSNGHYVYLPHRSSIVHQ